MQLLSALSSAAPAIQLFDDQHPVILESMEFPEPVIDIAIEPKEPKAGQQKMGEALAKLCSKRIQPSAQRPTKRLARPLFYLPVYRAGAYLEIIVDRLLREFNVETNVGAPQVVCKETFTKDG